MKIILDKRASVLRQIFRQLFVSTGANVNFQIAVALACLLDILIEPFLFQCYGFIRCYNFI